MYGIYPPSYNIKMRYMRTLCWLLYVFAMKCCHLGYEYIVCIFDGPLLVCQV